MVHGLHTFVLVYADDLLITGDDEHFITQLKASLHAAFTIKDLGLACYFLAIEIACSSTGTFLNQRKYIMDILTDAGLTTAKPAKFPLPKALSRPLRHDSCCLIQKFVEELLADCCT